MITKVCHFKGKDEHGNVFVEHFVPGEMIKTAAPMHPDIRAFMVTVKPDPNLVYVLVNALGASEVWGQNVNGDVFPEYALTHVPDGWDQIPVGDIERRMRAVAAMSPQYGHTTFYNSNAFKHHANKDPNKGFGRVVMTAWNDSMKRVEIVIALDRQLAELNGAADIIEKIENGEYPDVSMGCFLEGAHVTMADGTRKPIEQVVVGEEVITHKGRVRKVTQVHKRSYEGYAYGIKPAVGEVIWSTEEHPWWVVPEEQVKYGSPSWRRWDTEVEELDPEWVCSRHLEDHLLLSPVIEETITPDYVDRAFARLFGYYLAEGHVLRDKNKEICGLELSVHRDDPVHDEIDRLCEEFGTKNAPVTHDRPHCASAQGICVFDKKLALLCYEHGGGYAKKKKLSREALRWHPDMQREILGAYANGDGHGLPTGALSLSTASTDLAWQWVAVLHRMGILPSIQNLMHKAGSGFSAQATYEWVVHIGKQWAQGLRDVTSKVVESELLRARNDRVLIGGNVVTPIREISRIQVSTSVYNLEVEEDESYLVGGLSVHNCRVPFDICTICGHKSKTRNDYCEHARTMMGKILPDGRIVGVINTIPRFFDISFVFIGADRTAKVMAKLAAVDQYTYVPEAALYLPSAEVAYGLGYEKTSSALATAASLAFKPITPMDRRRIEKSTARGINTRGFIPGGEAGQATLSAAARVAGRAASRAVHLPTSRPVSKVTNIMANKLALKAANKIKEKYAAQYKIGDISKMIEGDGAHGKIMRRLEREDQDLPTDLLDHLGHTCGGSRGLGELLSSSGSLGMVLKPREFQRVILISIGSKPMADDLDRRNRVFDSVDDIDDSVPMGGDVVTTALRHILAPYMQSRSCLEPILRRRVIQALQPGNRGISVGSKPAAEKNAILDKVAAAYNGYRMGLIGMVPEILGQEEVDDRVLRELHYDDLIDAFSGEKTASVSPVMKAALPLLLALGPLVYLSASHWEAQEKLHGEKLPFTKKLISEHPVIASALAIGGGGRAAVGADKALARLVKATGRSLA